MDEKRMKWLDQIEELREIEPEPLDGEREPDIGGYNE